MKYLFKLLIVLFVILLLISSGTTLIYQITGSHFDPIKKIKDLQYQNRRDEALDLVQFYEGNKTIDPQKIKELKADLEYTLIEKFKSIAMGAVTGRVYDTYSGYGAVSSDFSLYGDIRDLSIQSWKYLKNEETDSIVAALSGIGILFSTAPYFDGLASYSKNAGKYIRNISGISCNNSLLKKVLKGKLSVKESKQVLTLLKKTHGPYPALQQFYQISAT